MNHDEANVPAEATENQETISELLDEISDIVDQEFPDEDTEAALWQILNQADTGPDAEADCLDAPDAVLRLGDLRIDLPSSRPDQVHDCEWWLSEREQAKARIDASLIVIQARREATRLLQDAEEQRRRDVQAMEEMLDQTLTKASEMLSQARDTVTQIMTEAEQRAAEIIGEAQTEAKATIQAAQAAQAAQAEAARAAEAAWTAWDNQTNQAGTAGSELTTAFTGDLLVRSGVSGISGLGLTRLMAGRSWVGRTWQTRLIGCEPMPLADVVENYSCTGLWHSELRDEQPSGHPGLVVSRQNRSDIWRLFPALLAVLEENRGRRTPDLLMLAELALRQVEPSSGPQDPIDLMIPLLGVPVSFEWMDIGQHLKIGSNVSDVLRARTYFQIRYREAEEQKQSHRTREFFFDEDRTRLQRILDQTRTLAVAHERNPGDEEPPAIMPSLEHQG